MKIPSILRLGFAALALSAVGLFAQNAYDEAPRPLRNPAPAYPSEIATEKVSAKVLLAVYVDVNGDVSEVKVLKSSDTRFDEIAATSVKSNWKFQPALLGGKPVACKVNIPIRFEPENS